MKMSIRLCALLCALFSSFILLPSAFPQGSLTPPGTPGPTMKTLDQLQPRMPLAGATSTVTLSSPGSYYLTGDIAVVTGNGIVISADNVTLDLSGFTVSSSAASPIGSGVLLSGDRSGIHILNGHIQGTVTYNGSTFSGGGFDTGIFAGGSSVSWRVTGVSVVGVSSLGIGDFQNFAIVDSCNVQTINGIGIAGGVVSNCRAHQCFSTGIMANTALDCVATGSSINSCIQATAATNCSGVNSGGGAGITASTVNTCFGQSNSSVGINATIAQNSYGVSASNIGLNVFTATNCYGSSSGSNNGIHANTANNCYGESTSNRGINTDIATGCYGVSHGGSFGLAATYIANSSYGKSDTGTGLSSYIANSCRGDNSSGPSVLVSFKYNMP